MYIVVIVFVIIATSLMLMIRSSQNVHKAQLSNICHTVTNVINTINIIDIITTVNNISNTIITIFIRASIIIGE